MKASSFSLSVLIPNYNWDVHHVITALHKQLSESGVRFEILCFDDAPHSEFFTKNNALNTLKFVTYKANETPLGRAKNRNQLAQAATSDLLLFLDGDAGITHNPSFINNYLTHFVPGHVFCGGTAYGAKPTDSSLQLRYLYGKNREELAAETRQKHPWAGFSAFNFLIERSLFLATQFDESLSQSGHEDTLFGKALKLNNVAIRHINNAAQHLGVDESAVFLAKSKQAVENLRDLIHADLADEDIKLYAWYLRIRRAKMTAVIGSLYLRFKEKWEENLCGPQPNLRTFDLYRLGYLCTLPMKHITPK